MEIVFNPPTLFDHETREKIKKEFLEKIGEELKSALDFHKATITLDSPDINNYFETFWVKFEKPTSPIPPFVDAIKQKLSKDKV